MDQISSEQQQRLNSAGLTDDIRGVMADIERRLDRLRVAHADREREREELESRSEAVDQRARELDDLARELGDRQREHGQAVAEAESRFAELDAREASARVAFERAKARHDDVRAELARQREKLEADRSEVTAQHRAFEVERTRTHELAREAAQQVRDIEEDRSALEATARELDERQKDLDGQAATLADRLREIGQQRDALNARAEQLARQDRKLADVSRQTAEQREKLSGDSSDLQQQKQWLAEQTRQADLLRARVKQLEAQLEQSREQASADAGKADGATSHELEQTRTRLREAAGMIAQLREQLDHAKAQKPARPSGPTTGSASPDAEHVKRRQRRLKYVRRALQQERAKIVKAGELLRQRSAALAQQVGVRTVEAPRPAPEPKRGGPMAAMARMGLGMAGVAAAITMMAGVSWIAAGEVATPVYAARVTVAHDARGRDVLAEDLAGWQAFHESLMADPRFYEFAAERMRQRGMLGLGDAVLVKSFVEGSVSLSSNRDGELMLEVREKGAHRARRVAETLAIALAGQANTARERRPDGLPSVVSKEAAADARPLTNERVMYAGGIFVGLTLVSAALGGLASKRVSRLREQEAAEGHMDVHDMGESTERRINIS